MEKPAEADDAIKAPSDAQDDVDRYVNAAVGLPLPDGADPVEAAIRDHWRRVERERYIAQHKAICESLANAPRLEAERRLRGLKLLGIADDDPRCQLERLRADGYPESDPRVELARLRMAGLTEDHPLVRALSTKAKESPVIDRKEFFCWLKAALKQAHLGWNAIPGSTGSVRKWFTGHGPDDGEVSSRIVRKAIEIHHSEGLPLPASVELFVKHNPILATRTLKRHA